MREEIEAAALFITKLVNKNILQNGGGYGSSASSTNSHSSSSSSSSSSSESPPAFDDQSSNSMTPPANDQDKVEQFRQCLTKALYERFHNHWHPEQPTKGQAYRCIRLNEWDRHDIALQQACLQSGIDYKDLQLPVELTLWVDPDEVTCRFGETKGSHCLVAKFKDGELKDNNFNIDINNMDIEIFRQDEEAMMRHPSMQSSPEYTNKHQHNNFMNASTHLHHQHNQHQHQQHQPQPQTPPRPHHHHRSNMATAAMFQSPYRYTNYTNGGPVYYPF